MRLVKKNFVYHVILEQTYCLKDGTMGHVFKSQGELAEALKPHLRAKSLDEPLSRVLRDVCIPRWRPMKDDMFKAVVLMAQERLAPGGWNDFFEERLRAAIQLTQNLRTEFEKSGKRMISLKQLEFLRRLSFSSSKEVADIFVPVKLPWETSRKLKQLAHS